MTRFRVGDRVRAEREAPAKGTWSRYAGSVGTVTIVQHHEIGVSYAPADSTGGATNVWFLPSELVRVSPDTPVVPPKRAATGTQNPPRIDETGEKVSPYRRHRNRPQIDVSGGRLL